MSFKLCSDDGVKNYRRVSCGLQRFCLRHLFNVNSDCCLLCR